VENLAIEGLRIDEVVGSLEAVPEAIHELNEFVLRGLGYEGGTPS
jgi:hypothetical protein